MSIEVFLPKMSDHMETGEIVRWLAREGDRVEAGQPLLEVQTDKAVAEVPSPASGILKGVREGAVDGAEIPVGATLAYITAPDEPVERLPPITSAEPAKPPADEARGGVRDEAPRPPDGDLPGGVRATPAARRLARELGVDLRKVKGSGPEGRVTEEDVRAFPGKGTA